MPRNEFRQRQARAGDWFFILAGVMALSTSQPAFGHTLLITRGEVLVEECRATVELEVAVEDFVHWYGIGSDSNGLLSKETFDKVLERHAFALHRIFVIRDAAGSPLPSKPFSYRIDWPEAGITMEQIPSLWARYSTVFSFPCSPRFLTFQLLMGYDSPSVYWQAILAVRDRSADRSRILRLTSGGNVETVELDWSIRADLAKVGPSGGACRTEGVAGLKQACAEINVMKESVEVEIAIPLSMMQPWLMSANHGDEYLDSDELNAARAPMEALLSSAFGIECGGRTYSGLLMDMTFLPLEGDGLKTRTEVGRIFIPTGRLKARLRFGPFARLEEADFQWSLFNHALLSVMATIRSDRASTELEFTTIQPGHHWHR